ncbi:head GIN domain-containing protein [Christiangramia aquimixticola]|uniref:head GIN domain-containing protein n=1 Tax=Christiangramia aquimixticola TaxID=1697558 RepID=UPI003AA8400B
MKKLMIFFGLLVILGCNSEDAGNCFQTEGDLVEIQVEVEPFSKIEVFERINLVITQGDQQKVMIQTGKNLLNEIKAEVKDGMLILKNENSCNLFRDYNTTSVHVTVTNLDYLRNSGNLAIKSNGILVLDNLWLVSENQAKDPEVRTNGDFDLELKVKILRITSDNYSHFFLKGEAEKLDAFFAAGEGRLEGRDLMVQHCDLFHRGTNKLIVNPQQSLKGDIFSYGDIISVNRPPVVDVKEHFKGRLIFEN